MSESYVTPHHLLMLHFFCCPWLMHETCQDRKSLARLFDRIDLDGSGQLTVEELIEGTVAYVHYVIPWLCSIPKTTGDSAISLVLDISRIMRQSCSAFKILVRSRSFFARCDVGLQTQRIRVASIWKCIPRNAQPASQTEVQDLCSRQSKATDSYQNLYVQKVQVFVEPSKNSKPFSHSLDRDNHKRQPPTATCHQALSEMQISKVVCVSWTLMRVTCKCSLKWSMLLDSNMQNMIALACMMIKMLCFCGHSALLSWFHESVLPPKPWCFQQNVFLFLDRTLRYP